MLTTFRILPAYVIRVALMHSPMIKDCGQHTHGKLGKNSLGTQVVIRILTTVNSRLVPSEPVSQHVKFFVRVIVRVIVS